MAKERRNVEWRAALFLFVVC